MNLQSGGKGLTCKVEKKDEPAKWRKRFNLQSGEKG